MADCHGLPGLGMLVMDLGRQSRQLQRHAGELCMVAALSLGDSQASTVFCMGSGHMVYGLSQYGLGLPAAVLYQCRRGPMGRSQSGPQTGSGWSGPLGGIAAAVELSLYLAGRQIQCQQPAAVTVALGCGPAAGQLAGKRLAWRVVQHLAGHRGRSLHAEQVLQRCVSGRLSAAHLSAP